MPRATPFIGRQRELAVLRGHLTAALRGQGGVVLVAGEPGIGKTRLVEQFAVEAARAGAPALWGRCCDGEAAPAYWPWVQLLRAYAALCDPADLAARLGEGAADLVQIDPALGQRLPGSPAARPALEPAAAPFRLFTSVGGFGGSTTRAPASVTWWAVWLICGSWRRLVVPRKRGRTVD
jgi:AAA ATPase-like protein